MRQILKGIHNVVTSICQPNPKLYLDPSARKTQWNRNILNLYMAPFLILLYNIFAAVFDYPSSMRWAFTGTHFFVLISFTLFYRSHMWVFNICYTAVAFFFELFLLDMVKEATYFYVGHVYVVFVSIMIRTESTGLAVSAGVIQIFTLLTKFKQKFAILMEEEEPEILADKFVKITLFYYMMMLLISVTLVKTLKRRTGELAEAKTSLENVLEQQKTFIFSFSHELRNPINSLLGNLQLALQQGEKNFPKKIIEMISTAKVCGEILLHNINNVLDTGKYEIGKLEVNPVATQTHEMFQRPWSIYSELMRQKKLTGQLKIDKEIPAVVKIDSYKVNQIMLNLIGNSIKFTERGSVNVKVKWLKDQEIDEKCFEPKPFDEMEEGIFEKDGNLSMVSKSRFVERRLLGSRRNSEVSSPSQERSTRGILKIIINDTGCGIKKEALEKLFQKFSQVSENLSQREIGTGLGLFITKEICSAMNGEIRAYSKLGVGTTFIICIPTVSVPVGENERAGSQLLIEKLAQKNVKALVADDSILNVNLICNYFSQFGGSVVSVSYNGYDVFMRYKECRMDNVKLDVVTLDIDMPLMDGLAVCDKIREYERNNKLKPVVIILISGNYDKEQMDEYVNPQRELRADCFLRKSVSFSDFNRAVYKYVVR